LEVLVASTLLDASTACCNSAAVDFEDDRLIRDFSGEASGIAVSLDVAETAEARVITGCVPAVDVAMGVKFMTHSCCFVDSDKGQMRTAITGPVFAERTGSIGKSCAYLSVVGKREASEYFCIVNPKSNTLMGINLWVAQSTKLWQLVA
jgi:hypothetical protein